MYGPLGVSSVEVILRLWMVGDEFAIGGARLLVLAKDERTPSYAALCLGVGRVEVVHLEVVFQSFVVTLLLQIAMADVEQDG